MRAILIEAFNQLPRVATVPDPTPTPQGVVLKVLASGICRSDWHGWVGHDTNVALPHVPGHELVGEVVATGSEVRRFQAGARVTVPFVVSCGHCGSCHAGDQQVCASQFQPGFTHWGSFAEYVAIDFADANLVHLPESISAVTGASLGCRFATAFRAVVDQGKLSAGQCLAVHGCGGVGLSAIMIAKALGAFVIAVDINPQALETAKQLGAHALIDARNTDNVAEQVKALSQGGAHVSIDALGHAAIAYQSVSCLRRRGKHVQVGLLMAEQANTALPMDQVIAYELEILGSHGMQAHRYPALLQLISCAGLQPEQLVSETVDLTTAVDRLVQLDQPRQHAGMSVINQF